MGNSGNYRGDNDDTLVKGENVTSGNDENILSHNQRLYQTLVGKNGDRVDVSPDGSGTNRLATDAVVTVVSQLGFDDIADSWFAIGDFDDSTGADAASAGDTVRVQIAAGDDATRYPAIDVTYTLVAGDLTAQFPEVTIAKNVASALNADSTFRSLWTASTVKDNGIVHVSSKLKGEMGERPNTNDFTVTPTGGVTVTVGFNTIVRRNKTTSLRRDSEDPRIGILGISGSVEVTPGALGDLFIKNALNGGSSSLLVNGSGTPVDFTINAATDEDIFIQEMRFYGGGNGIKFGQFLSKNTKLTNGIEVTIQSDNESITLPLIKSTEDFKNKFAFGSAAAGQFSVDVQAGADQFLASFSFATPFPLRAVGSFTTDDFIRVRIRDDLTSGISTLEFIARGFNKEI